MSIHILLYLLCGFLLLFVILYTILRLARYIHKAPMPEYLADAIDNPVRRRIQPPDKTAIRHGIQPGMIVLEVGPGTGTYTVATAQRVGEKGKVVAIDIEPKMVDRVRKKVETNGLTNIDAYVANAYNLPFDLGIFDLIYLIAVIGEIPSPKKAIQEFHRVLSPTGTLVFSELLPDLDYPSVSTLVRWVTGAGFKLRKKVGNFFYYTLIFEKASYSEGSCE